MGGRGEREEKKSEERERERVSETETETERAGNCPSLAFQDHQLIIQLSKMQDIMHTNPNCVLHFIQSAQNYFTVSKICYKTNKTRNIKN